MDASPHDLTPSEQCSGFLLFNDIREGSKWVADELEELYEGLNIVNRRWFRGLSSDKYLGTYRLTRLYFMAVTKVLAERFALLDERKSAIIHYAENLLFQGSNSDRVPEPFRIPYSEYVEFYEGIKKEEPHNLPLVESVHAEFGRWLIAKVWGGALSESTPIGRLYFRQVGRIGKKVEESAMRTIKRIFPQDRH